MTTASRFSRSGFEKRRHWAEQHPPELERALVATRGHRGRFRYSLSHPRRTIVAKSLSDINNSRFLSVSTLASTDLHLNVSAVSLPSTATNVISILLVSLWSPHPLTRLSSNNPVLILLRIILAYVHHDHIKHAQRSPKQRVSLTALVNASSTFVPVFALAST